MGTGHSEKEKKTGSNLCPNQKLISLLTGANHTDATSEGTKTKALHRVLWIKKRQISLIIFVFLETSVGSSMAEVLIVRRLILSDPSQNLGGGVLTWLMSLRRENKPWIFVTTNV